MIQIKNLTIVHKKDTRVILEDFSCVLGDGDKAVIIGEEGNGKSTLLQWLYSPDRIGDYCEARGERFVRGHRMGYLPQELPGQEKEKSVYEYFMEESMFLEQDPKDLNRMAREFGLPVDFFYREQPMGTLSGGER